MRALALALVLVAGCTEPPRDGALACGSNAAHPCPDGYDCVEGRCYVVSHVFDMSAAMESHDMTLPPSPSSDMDDPDQGQGCGTVGQPCCIYACTVGLVCTFSDISCGLPGFCRASSEAAGYLCSDGSSCGPCP
jgi:hypothetical protein